MKTLKEYVIEEAKKSGDLHETKGDLYEFFDEVLAEAVHVGERDKHRWYTNVWEVYKVVIDGDIRYFQWYYVEINEGCDSDPEDCGWTDPDLDDLPEVFPKEVKTIIYVTEDNL